MPTARQRSPPGNRIEFLPPSVSSVSSPSRNCSSSASTRYRDLPPAPFGTAVRYDSLQQELDALELEEEDHELALCETKEFGYSWLVPLGRQTTHEEEDDDASQFSTSPATGHTHRTVDLLPPPPLPELGMEMNARRATMTTTTTTAGRIGTGWVEDEPGGDVVDLDAEIEDADRSDDDDDENEDEDEDAGRDRDDEDDDEPGMDGMDDERGRGATTPAERGERSRSRSESL